MDQVEERKLPRIVRDQGIAVPSERSPLEILFPRCDDSLPKDRTYDLVFWTRERIHYSLDPHLEYLSKEPAHSLLCLRACRIIGYTGAGATRTGFSTACDGSIRWNGGIGSKWCESHRCELRCLRILVRWMREMEEHEACRGRCQESRDMSGGKVVDTLEVPVQAAG